MAEPDNKPAGEKAASGRGRGWMILALLLTGWTLHSALTGLTSPSNPLRVTDTTYRLTYGTGAGGPAALCAPDIDTAWKRAAHLRPAPISVAPDDTSRTCA